MRHVCVFDTQRTSQGGVIFLFKKIFKAIRFSELIFISVVGFTISAWSSEGTFCHGLLENGNVLTFKSSPAREPISKLAQETKYTDNIIKMKLPRSWIETQVHFLMNSENFQKGVYFLVKNYPLDPKSGGKTPFENLYFNEILSLFEIVLKDLFGSLEPSVARQLNSALQVMPSSYVGMALSPFLSMNSNVEGVTPILGYRLILKIEPQVLSMVQEILSTPLFYARLADYFYWKNQEKYSQFPLISFYKEPFEPEALTYLTELEQGHIEKNIHWKSPLNQDGRQNRFFLKNVLLLLGQSQSINPEIDKKLIFLSQFKNPSNALLDLYARQASLLRGLDLGDYQLLEQDLNQHTQDVVKALLLAFQNGQLQKIKTGKFKTFMSQILSVGLVNEVIADAIDSPLKDLGLTEPEISSAAAIEFTRYFGLISPNLRAAERQTDENQPLSIFTNTIF